MQRIEKPASNHALCDNKGRLGGIARKTGGDEGTHGRCRRDRHLAPQLDHTVQQVLTKERADVTREARLHRRIWRGRSRDFHPLGSRLAHRLVLLVDPGKVLDV